MSDFTPGVRQAPSPLLYPLRYAAWVAAVTVATWRLRRAERRTKLSKQLSPYYRTARPSSCEISEAQDAFNRAFIAYAAARRSRPVLRRGA